MATQLQVKPTWASDTSSRKVTCQICGAKVLFRDHRRFTAAKTGSQIIVTCQKGNVPHTKKD